MLRMQGRSRLWYVPTLFAFLFGALAHSPRATARTPRRRPRQPAPPGSPSLRLLPRPPPSATPPTAATARKRKDPSACPKSGPLTFDDPATETVVRRQLQKPTGAITSAELKKIKTLDLSQAAHDDELDPCLFPYFSGVKGLYLAPGDLDDISLLKKLLSIESLRLAATKVTDLSALAALTKLDRLDLGRTPVRDITPLSQLVNLTELQLDETEVSDLFAARSSRQARGPAAQANPRARHFTAPRAAQAEASLHRGFVGAGYFARLRYPGSEDSPRAVAGPIVPPGRR